MRTTPLLPRPDTRAGAGSIVPGEYRHQTLACTQLPCAIILLLTTWTSSMADAALAHFKRAASDIGACGDNDTLPFDVDTRFISENGTKLAELAFDFYSQLKNDSVANSKSRISALPVFNERLLVPAGPAGFRVSTKIQSFWNLYFNGLGVAIADTFETRRDDRAHSYRFLKEGEAELFDRNHSWRAFRESTAKEVTSANSNQVVVQTDISGFYEHISHHYIENCINDLFPDDGRIAAQIVALLSKFSAGRSYGLPVGSQGSRILAELLLSHIDRRMTAAGVSWHRYVDDYILIAGSNASAYKALATLAHTLADYGLALNRTKTIFLSAKHYTEYVGTQLGLNDSEAGKLREIDLHFDPYSDTPVADYESLKQAVAELDVRQLLDRELEKALPDTFLVTQIGRTLRLHAPVVAIRLVTTLLSPTNLHAFRASWSTIMRGVANLRATGDFHEIFGAVDELLDQIPNHSLHLLQAEAGLLHYLRTLRFRHTAHRAAFVYQTYNSTQSDTVKRSCIDCWRHWKDRDGFTLARNHWDRLSMECQRMLWLASYAMGDQGEAFRRQVRQNVNRTWLLGIERQNTASYASIYEKWCDDPQNSI